MLTLFVGMSDLIQKFAVLYPGKISNPEFFTTYMAFWRDEMGYPSTVLDVLKDCIGDL